MARDTNSVLGGLIIYDEGVNLASSVIWSTYANKRTKALNNEKGSKLTASVEPQYQYNCFTIAGHESRSAQVTKFCILDLNSSVDRCRLTFVLICLDCCLHRTIILKEQPNLGQEKQC